MLTIFTIPKPFKGHIDLIQRNAIKSWLKVQPQCEVILFGDEEGVAEAAAEFNILNIREIKKNEFGTPLLDSVFNSAQKIAKNKILVYINTDDVLMGDFMPAIQKIDKSLFLLSGQRWDMDIKEAIQFDKIDWEEKLRDDIIKNGRIHRPSGMDYCVFPRHLEHKLPSLAVGRPGWDNWLIYRAKSLKIPVIDATETVTVVHQNHPSIYHPLGKEAKINFKLAGGFTHMMTLRDADWVLTARGLERPPFPRRIFSLISLFYPWRLLLALKRKLQSGTYNKNS